MGVNGTLPLLESPAELAGLFLRIALVKKGFGFIVGGIDWDRLSAENVGTAGGGLTPERDAERRDIADGSVDFGDGDCNCDFKEGEDLEVDNGDARAVEDGGLGGGEELLREGTRCSMDMLSIEPDLDRPFRGRLFLETIAAAEIEDGGDVDGGDGVVFDDFGGDDDDDGMG